MKHIGLILISLALIVTFRPHLFQGIVTGVVPGGQRAVVPSKELQTIVTSIRQMDLSRSDGQRLCTFYEALADVIERDESGIIKTGAEVRLLNERSGKLCFARTGITGRYPHLAEHIDTVIGHGLGSKYRDGQWESVEISAANRQGLVTALRALAWACQR